MNNNSAFKLPPISSMELPNRPWVAQPQSPPDTLSSSFPTPPQPEQLQWKSPPYHHSNEFKRDQSYNHINEIKRDQSYNHINEIKRENPYNLPSEIKREQNYMYPNEFKKDNYSSEMKQDNSSYSKYHSNTNNELNSQSFLLMTRNKIEKDIDEVVRQCNKLSDNVISHKNQFNQQESISSRPILDDMITRANEVLNALLRLRKHQLASEQYQIQQKNQHINNTHNANNINNNNMNSSFHSSSIWQSSSLSSNNHHTPVKQRRRGKRPAFQGRCHSCNISETPEWRRGPNGARTLCNACGLHYAKLARKQQENRGMSLTQREIDMYQYQKYASMKPPGDEVIIHRSPS